MKDSLNWFLGYIILFNSKLVFVYYCCLSTRKREWQVNYFFLRGNNNELNQSYFPCNMNWNKYTKNFNYQQLLSLLMYFMLQDNVFYLAKSHINIYWDILPFVHKQPDCKEKWKSNIGSQTKFKLYKSIVISILLHGCETWTHLVEAEKRTQAF